MRSGTNPGGCRCPSNAWASRPNIPRPRRRRPIFDHSLPVPSVPYPASAGFFVGYSQRYGTTAIPSISMKSTVVAFRSSPPLQFTTSLFYGIGRRSHRLRPFAFYGLPIFQWSITVKKQRKSKQPAPASPETNKSGHPDPLDDIARRIAVLIVKQHRYLVGPEKAPRRARRQ